MRHHHAEELLVHMLIHAPVTCFATMPSWHCPANFCIPVLLSGKLHVQVLQSHTTSHADWSSRCLPLALPATLTLDLSTAALDHLVCFGHSTVIAPDRCDAILASMTSLGTMLVCRDETDGTNCVKPVLNVKTAWHLRSAQVL